jgi:hypothetical protein
MVHAAPICRRATARFCSVKTRPRRPGAHPPGAAASHATVNIKFLLDEMQAQQANKRLCAAFDKYQQPDICVRFCHHLQQVMVQAAAGAISTIQN